MKSARLSPFPPFRVSLWPRLKPRVFPVAARNDLVAGRSSSTYKGHGGLIPTRLCGLGGVLMLSSSGLRSVFTHIAVRTGQIERCQRSPIYSVVFPSALALAHLALAAAASLALTAGLLRRSFFLAAGFAFFPALPLYLAHLARAAAAMARRPAADILRLPFGLPGPLPVPPAMASRWFCKSSICSLMSIMR